MSPRFLQPSPAAHRFVLDYLSEEVLAQQPELSTDVSVAHLDPGAPQWAAL